MSIFQYNICRFGSFDKGVAAWFNDTLFKKKSGGATEIFLATKSRPQRCLNKYKEESNLQRTSNSSTVLILSFKYTIPSIFCTNILLDHWNIRIKAVLMFVYFYNYISLQFRNISKEIHEFLINMKWLCRKRCYQEEPESFTS